MAADRFGFEIETHRLENGLDIVLQPDDRLPLVAVNLWYHVGSRNERPGRTGLAHLFEHMLFQGSANVGVNDHFGHLQKVGGVANGSTWYDRTNYYETVPSHELELALWLESDRMGFLLDTLDSEKLENQREVVMNERRQRIDNQPYGAAFETLFARLFPSPHPYSWPVIGTMQDIAAIDLEDVRSFFVEHYHPGNAVLTLAGDFDTRRAVELADRYFGSLPTADASPPPEHTHAPPETEPVELPDDVELPRLYVGYPIPPFGTPEWSAADLLSTALASGKSSPLYRDLVHERQLLQGISLGTLPTELAGSVLLTCTGRPGTTPQELLAAVDEHLDRARAELLPAVEFERSRNQLTTAYLEQLQSLEARADVLSQSATYFGDPRRYTDRLDATADLSAGQVRDFAARWWQPDNRAVVAIVPRGTSPVS